MRNPWLAAGPLYTSLVQLCQSEPLRSYLVLILHVRLLLSSPLLLSAASVACNTFNLNSRQVRALSADSGHFSTHYPVERPSSNPFLGTRNLPLAPRNVSPVRDITSTHPPTHTHTTVPSFALATQSHRRRLSSGNYDRLNAGIRDLSPSKTGTATTSGLPTIQSDTWDDSRGHMSLSRSPSPQARGGWSSPGLNTPSGRSRATTPKPYTMNGGHDVTWASAQARSAEVNGYPAYHDKSAGFFGRHLRSISVSLPRFSMGEDDRFAEKEKLGRGRWQPGGGSAIGNILGRFGRMFWRMRLRFMLVIAFVLLVILFYATRKSSHWRCMRMLSKSVALTGLQHFITTTGERRG